RKAVDPARARAAPSGAEELGDPPGAVRVQLSWSSIAHALLISCTVFINMMTMPFQEILAGAIQLRRDAQGIALKGLEIPSYRFFMEPFPKMFAANHAEIGIEGDVSLI